MKIRKPKKRAKKARSTLKRPSDILDERDKRIQELRTWLDSLGQADPEWAAAYAAQVLEIGTETLLGLIESKKLTNLQDFCDGAETRLCGYFERLIHELCWLVKNGNEAPVSGAWRGAAKLAKALHDLALATASDDEGLFSLQKIAGSSMYMPSLRTNVKKFDYNFGEIAKKIGLSLNCATNTGWTWTSKGFKPESSKAKYDLNSLVTQFVVEFIERVSQYQSITGQAQAWLLSMQKLAATTPQFQEYLALTLGDFMRREYNDAQLAELMTYHDSPKFNGDSVGEFWKRVLQPYLEKPETLEQLRGTALYRELEGATDGKDYQMRAILKQRCEQALRSKTLVKESAFP